MATYGVDPNNLIDTGQELTVATNAINQALDALDNAVNNYRGSNTGQTSEAFQAAQAKWHAGVQEMNQALANGARALDDISNTYRITDQKGASSFS
jgi:WXG100 family type VII secretion target